MPSITKLKIQKNKKRVNVYLDGKFAFGLGLDEVVKKGLSVGQQLTDSQVEKLFFSSQLEKLYNKTLNFLSYRPRSEKEIKDYLRKNFTKLTTAVGQLGKKIQVRILAKLKKQKLIDDYKFASWWIEQRLTFKPRGKRLLKAELFKKGVDKEIINQTLATIDSQQLTILARKIVNKKKRLYQQLPKLELKQKLFSHLARRGFDFEIIKNVIDEILEK